MKRITYAMAIVVMLSMTACSNLDTQEERALSGGAMGAGGGLVIGTLVGGPLVGALVGAGAGTAVGAFTSNGQVHVDPRPAQRQPAQREPTRLGQYQPTNR
ncbi:MAG: hypothetical protein HY521_01165 [Proteobacteria bacterium]|nr:hypothetical protein [Pseudomonadota bacterium]